MTSIRRYIANNSWLWAALASLLLWLVMGITANRLNLESFISNAYTATFLALLAYGQMLVITSGREPLIYQFRCINTDGFYFYDHNYGVSANIPLALIVVLVISLFIGF